MKFVNKKYINQLKNNTQQKLRLKLHTYNLNRAKIVKNTYFNELHELGFFSKNHSSNSHELKLYNKYSKLCSYCKHLENRINRIHVF